MNALIRGGLAEFLGTFALVFFGAGSIILTQSPYPDIDPHGSLVTVALAHGLVLTVFVTACFYVSGAQFNPAVSIALLAIGKQDLRTTTAYIISQLFAAVSGAGMLVLLLGRDEPTRGMLEHARLGATLGLLSSGETANPFAVFGLEVLMTFALMFIILAAVVDQRAHKLGGFCVGLVVATCIVGFGPLTGASMNPARSFGPALYGHWDMHWVYWVAPIAGAVAAGLAYKHGWPPEEATP